MVKKCVQIFLLNLFDDILSLELAKNFFFIKFISWSFKRVYIIDKI